MDVHGVCRFVFYVGYPKVQRLRSLRLLDDTQSIAHLD